MLLIRFTVISLLIVCCQTQFHQDSYHIIHDRVEISNYNHTAVINPIIKLFNISNIKQAFNASAYFTPGVKKNIVINAAVFRFVSKQYRPFPINVTIDLCEEYSKSILGIDMAVKLSNFRGCPCEVGDYWIHDVSLEEDRFPPHIPFGKYKLAVHVQIDDHIYLGRGFWYGSIVSKSKWQKETHQ